MKTVKQVKEASLRFEEEYHHTEKTNFLKALDPYVKYMPILLSSHTANHSKQLMLALAASMEGIVKGKGAFGLFSEDFEKLCHLVARGLAKCSKAGEAGGEEMELRLLSQLIMGALSSLTGLLWLAYDQTILGPADEGVSKKGDFFLELLIRSIFSSEIPKSTLQAISEATGLTGDFPTKSLETLALLFVLIGFTSRLSEPRGTHDAPLLASLLAPLLASLLDAIKNRLSRNFEAMETALTDLANSETLSREDLKPIRLFLGQGKQALASGNFDTFFQGLWLMAKPYNISIANLQEDIQTSRRLFSALGTNFRLSAQAKDNIITFSG